MRSRPTRGDPRGPARSRRTPVRDSPPAERTRSADACDPARLEASARASCPCLVAGGHPAVEVAGVGPGMGLLAQARGPRCLRVDEPCGEPRLLGGARGLGSLERVDARDDPGVVQTGSVVEQRGEAVRGVGGSTTSARLTVSPSQPSNMFRFYLEKRRRATVVHHGNRCVSRSSSIPCRGLRHRSEHTGWRDRTYRPGGWVGPGSADGGR